MPLEPGIYLGHYEIVAPIGAGGMGEVYKAWDRRLNRIVAIKILTKNVPESAELKRRFELEAQTLANLSHAHICPIFDVGQHNEMEYLVMEYLEGQTLAKRLERGLMPLDEALRIATAISDALDKAHRQGFVHRDVKPANIMLTKSGSKLLDFGLAKQTLRATSETGVSLLQTNADLTVRGTILGTLEYMSPEQLDGTEADARADVWGFGCVLYEMVTGKKPFRGAGQSTLIGAILKDDPEPVAKLRELTPRALERLIRRCLIKDREVRQQSAHDVWLELKSIAEEKTERESPPERRRASAWGGWIAAAIFFLTALALGLVVYRPAATEPRETLFALTLPPGVELASSVNNINATNGGTVSPDGRHLVFVATPESGTSAAPMLWVRPLNSAQPRPLPGTEGASFPFWSPDSDSIAFFADGKLRRVELSGSQHQIICDAESGRGGTWNKDGIIVMAATSRSPLSRVPAAGGVAVEVTKLVESRQEASHRWPSFLPDGQHFLYFAHGSPNAVYVGSLDGDTSILLDDVEANAIYANPGYLFFSKRDALLAQAFDPSTLSLTGETFRVVEPIAVDSRERAKGAGLGLASMSVSENGVLTYRAVSPEPMVELLWIDRSGKVDGRVGDRGYYRDPALSPDGKKLAVARRETSGGSHDIWIFDLDSDESFNLTNNADDDLGPVWSPDGNRIIFRSSRDGEFRLYEKAAVGTGEEKLVATSKYPMSPYDWSQDGQFLTYHEGIAGQGNDLTAMALSGNKKVKVAGSVNAEGDGHFSTDGRWIVYSSNETGRYEIYVQRFPDSSDRRQLTTTGGADPVWSRDSREIFYVNSGTGELMALTVKPGTEFEFDAHKIIAANLDWNSTIHSFDVSRDGQRFLIVSHPSTASPITVVLNWTGLLKK